MVSGVLVFPDTGPEGVCISQISESVVLNLEEDGTSERSQEMNLRSHDELQDKGKCQTVFYSLFLDFLLMIVSFLLTESPLSDH